jgi:hypothetical protein
MHFFYSFFSATNSRMIVNKKGCQIREFVAETLQNKNHQNVRIFRKV